MVGVDAEAAQADRAEFLVADGDRSRRAPVLVGLQPRGEEVDVGFERRLELLVPVHQVGQQRQGLGVQRVEARAEDVGDAAFVDEHRHLRLAHRELAAVLDLHVLHGIAVREDAVFRFGPVDDVDELLGEKGSNAHGVPFRLLSKYTPKPPGGFAKPLTCGRKIVYGRLTALTLVA